MSVVSDRSDGGIYSARGGRRARGFEECGYYKLTYVASEGNERRKGGANMAVVAVAAAPDDAYSRKTSGKTVTEKNEANRKSRR